MTVRAKPRVLVVDDLEANVEILQILLAQHYDLSVAYSGEQALEIFAEAAPDLVLLDVMMPGIDGHETCRRLRQTPEGRRARIIMVSAKAMGSELRQGLDAGADDYITKPFMEGDLLDRLEAFVRLGAAEAQNRDAESVAYRNVVERQRDERDTFERKENQADAIRRGEVTMTSTPRDLGPLLERVVAEANGQSVGRGIDVRAELDTALQATFDARWLESALTPLLDHAVSQCGTNSLVQVEARCDREAARIVISWSLSGTQPFDPEWLDSIRTLDVTDHQRNRLMDLRLAREIVRALGGRLAFEAPDELRRVLRLSLPVAEASAVTT